jgi:hypothetical protein
MFFRKRRCADNTLCVVNKADSSECSRTMQKQRMQQNAAKATIAAERRKSNENQRFTFIESI